MLGFREAKIEDLSQLLELEQCIIEAERPYDSELKTTSTFYYDLKELILSSDSHLVVAEVGHQLIGTGYAQIRASKECHKHSCHTYFGFMYVDPSYRGKGINAKIMELLMTWSKNRGVSNFYLDVYADNKAAIRAYEKVGFSASLVKMELSADETDSDE